MCSKFEKNKKQNQWLSFKSDCYNQLIAKRSIVMSQAKALMLRKTETVTIWQRHEIIENRVLALVSSSLVRMPVLESKYQWTASYPAQCIQWSEWQRILSQPITSISEKTEKKEKKHHSHSSKSRSHKHKSEKSDKKEKKHKHRSKSDSEASLPQEEGQVE